MVMDGPFGLPWSTFSAFLVIVFSVAVAAVWSVLSRGGGDGDE